MFCDIHGCLIDFRGCPECSIENSSTSQIENGCENCGHSIFFENKDGLMAIPRDDDSGYHLFRLYLTETGHYLLPIGGEQCGTKNGYASEGNRRGNFSDFPE